MTPKNYLLTGGIMLIALGILGMTGVLGPTVDHSIFHQSWWLSPVKSWIYLVLGIADVVMAHVLSKDKQFKAVLILGFASLFLLAHTFIVQTPVMEIELQNPGDSIFFLFFAVWGIGATAAQEKN